MARYLMSIYQPDGGPPEKEFLDRIMQNVFALNEEMKAAGAWVFTAGLTPADSATVVRSREGEVMLTDGPFVEGKEHVGGFYIIEAADLDEALGWGGKLSRATTLPIEVRPVQRHDGG